MAEEKEQEQEGGDIYDVCMENLEIYSKLIDRRLPGEEQKIKIYCEKVEQDLERCLNIFLNKPSEVRAGECLIHAIRRWPNINPDD